MKLTSEELVLELSIVVDASLARAAIENYVEMQQRFLAGDWQPTELDGGRLCEAVSRCLLQLDKGILDHRKLPSDIRDILLDSRTTHDLAWKDRYHIAKVIEVIYKFRSDRGPVHISPIYTANYMDSMLVLHAGKWMLAEFLRLAWKKDQEVISEVIAQLVQLEHSLIHELDGKPLVLVKNISAPEEVLLLLNHAPNNRLSKAELYEQAVNQSRNNLSTAISRLITSKDIRPAGDEVALTPNGQKRVFEEILPKFAPKK
jgi:hypothetical protein